jgi:hypothetical protein
MSFNKAVSDIYPTLSRIVLQARQAHLEDNA